MDPAYTAARAFSIRAAQLVALAALIEGSSDQTEVFLSYMYNQAFNFLDFGYASAIAWMLAALILAISLVQFRLIKSAYEY